MPRMSQLAHAHVATGLLRTSRRHLIRTPLLRVQSGFEHAATASPRQVAALTMAGATVLWGTCATASCSYLSVEEQGDIAATAVDSCKLPLIPQSIQLVVAQRVVKTIADKLDEHETATLVGADFKACFSEAMKNGPTDELLDTMCKQLNASVDMPLLNEKQEQQLISSVLRATLADASTRNRVLDEAIVQSAQGIAGLFSDDATQRKQLVARINKHVDIPILDEEQEAVLIDSGLSLVINVVCSLLPPDYVSALKRGTSPVEYAQLQNLIQMHAEKNLPPIPGLDDQQKHDLVAGVISVVFESMIDGTTIEVALTAASPEERLGFLQRELKRHEVPIQNCPVALLYTL
eukprot:SAG31_NODE_1171_length_9560_cov_11.668745_6_plen_349_part_00